MRDSYGLGVGLLIALALGPCLGSAPAIACTCTSIPTFEEAFQNSDAVFTGYVVGSESAGPEHPDDIWIIMISSSWWKGPLAGSVRVLTAASDGLCGYPFRVGHEYLVYAWLNDGVLSTYLCWRTHETWADDPDLVSLGPPQTVPTLTRTWGALKAIYR